MEEKGPRDLVCIGCYQSVVATDLINRDPWCFATSEIHNKMNLDLEIIERWTQQLLNLIPYEYNKFEMILTPILYTEQCSKIHFNKKECESFVKTYLNMVF